MRKLLLLISILTLSACAATPSPTTAELAKADYGAYPTNYKQIVETGIKSVLVDEDSAKFRYVGAPKKTWNNFTSGRTFGWDICVEVNARNSLGGFVGYRPYYVMIKDGRVVYLRDPSCMNGMCVSSRCDEWVTR